MIQIGGKTYQLGMNLHVRLMYERMSGKMFGDNMLTMDIIILMYCVLIRFNKDTFQVGFEDFIDMLAKDDSVITQFCTWHTNYWKEREVMKREHQETVEKKN